MTLPTLALALILLLLTPGPTNTLILLAAAERGLPRALRLIPVELAAYLAAILPLALLSHALSAQIGLLRPIIATLAGAWVLYLAWTMWRTGPGTARPNLVSARRIAVTTFLNPKGLVMGLVLIPAAGLSPASVAVLAGSIATVALVWACAGCVLPRAERGFPPLITRLAALWLAGLSVMIVAGGLSA